MAFIQSGQSWQFSTESDLEEVIWHHLLALLNLRPLSRQFSISGKFCDILAVDDADRLVIIELKNTEDRYVVQQLIRYYDAISSAEALPFEVAASEPRLIAIAPSFHADTLTDCQYSTLSIELLTFSLEQTADGITLTIQDTSGTVVSTLCLSAALSTIRDNIEIPDPSRKLLNLLSHSSAAEYDWVIQMRRQLLSFDPRIKELVTASSIFYGCGQTKACCELRKVGSAGYIGRALAYFLWLPHLERKPQVMRMMVGFDMEKHRVLGLVHSSSSYRMSEGWIFPKSVELLQKLRYPQFQEYYQPLLNTDRTISSSCIVDLALQTWYSRL